jgi:hypothetical protein
MHVSMTKQFVILVERSSTDLVCPTSELPVLDYQKAAKNKNFMRFQEVLDENVDIRQYNDGWLVNDVHYLTEPITDDDIWKMEFALNGVIEENAGVDEKKDIREVLLSRSMRFHLVKQAVHQNGATCGDIPFFECDCREYYYHRWCFSAAYMQHRGELRLLGEKIVKRRAQPSMKNRKSMIVAAALEVAAVKRKQKS